MSRKYRHQGYQDSGSGRDDERRRSGPPPKSQLSTEERLHRRGLRHAMDRDANAVIRCHDCGRSIQSFSTIAPDTDCPYCNASLHCCRTCKHFDSSARWQCNAQIEGPVEDKSQANDCGSYTPRLVLDSTGKRSDASRSSGGAREQFESLFKR